MKGSWGPCCTSDGNSAMWDKARSLAAKHLKPAFDNLRIVSTEDQMKNGPEAPPQAVAEPPDRLLRRQAEFENFRRRTERDRVEFFEYAGMEVVRELLPVLDDFER